MAMTKYTVRAVTIGLEVVMVTTKFGVARVMILSTAIMVMTISMAVMAKIF